MESEGPRTDRGRDQKPPDGNVIRLPRDWVGPPDELVPIARSPARPEDESAAPEHPENGDNANGTLGAISDWLGPEEILVPVAGTSGASAHAPITGDAFWGEDAAAVHSAVARPVASASNPSVGTDGLRRRFSGLAWRRGLFWWWRGLPRAATWLPVALVVVAVGLVVRGAMSAAPVRHSVARLSSPPIAAQSAKTPVRAPVRARATGATTHTSPHRSVPKPTRAPSVVRARYTRVTPTAAVASAQPPAMTEPPAANAPAAQPTYTPAAAGGDSNRSAASTSSSLAAGPTGKGALTGAGTTPSG